MDASTSAAGSVLIDLCFPRMFVAAYLLMGSARQAEELMLESVRHLDSKATLNGCLSWKAITGAIARSAADSAPDGAAPIQLPNELLRVLRLPCRLRRCYALRVLMAMPRQYCAGLLRIAVEQVDVNTFLAARELSEMASGETQI
jgi:hypothetical protein